jgi:DNA mismatch repair protein MutS
MLDPTEIQTYYNIIDEMFLKASERADPLWLMLDKQLKELPDIGRLQRKLEIKLITPKELSVLYKAYLKIINIYINILQNKTPVLHGQMLTQEEIGNFNGFIARFGSIINFEALECCHVDTSSESDTKWLEFVDCPIRSGMYPDLDEQTRLLVNAENTLQQIVDHMNGFLVHTKGKKIEFKAAKKKRMGAKKQDPVGTILVTSAAKATTLANAQINTNLCGVIQVAPYTATDRMIISDRINALCSHIDGIRMWMRQKLLSIYDSIIEEMTKYTFFVPIANLIAKIDLIHSYAKVSHNFNYHRPELVTDGDVSYLEAKEIRHPIIERIIDGAYVTNDVFLGNGIPKSQSDGELTSRTNGMLLFGINTSGKSSLAKAIGLVIIMAQIGCFVPARLRYKPYSKIITRLTGNDNIFKGDSSFAVEMTELRTILRQSDATTLVVGDEAVVGTESNSATAITGSAILSLIDKRSTFLFATHMHELVNLSCIVNLPDEQLNICHLAISYDEQAEILIYDRKLRSGSGPSIYGLMIAKSLSLPDDFLNRANQLLLEISGENRDILPTNKSRYNIKVYIDSCALCGKTRSQTELQTHHLEEQFKADNRKLIGNMPMNAKDNLIILCRDCHTNLHCTGRKLESIPISNGTMVRMRPPTVNELSPSMELSLK